MEGVDGRLLPAGLRLGTSSWIYPGWKGSIYRNWYRTEQDFQRHCLEEYARWPWFRAVGVDATHYRPPRRPELQRLASQVPEDFRWVCKAGQRVTLPRFPRQRRFGSRSGLPNPEFLRPEPILGEVLPAFEDAEVRQRTGPFVLQFPRLGQDIPFREFLAGVDRLLRALPREFEWAVEIRNASFLQPAWFDLLNRHGATHVFNHWTSMPRLLDQMRAAARAGGLEAPFYLARLLTPRGLRYQAAVERFQPYTHVQEPVPEMREDAVRILRRAVRRGARALILANNRAEGHAPGTVEAIGRAFLAAEPSPAVAEELREGESPAEE